MKLIKASVDWYEGYQNMPRLEIDVEGGIENWQDMIYKKRKCHSGTFYFAEKDGAVDFYFSTSDKTGFGGSVFELKMEDGSIEKVVGPWSSRASIVGPLFDCKCTSATLIHTKYCPLSVQITLDVAIEAAKMAGVHLLAVDSHDEIDFIPSLATDCVLKPDEQKLAEGKVVGVLA